MVVWILCTKPRTVFTASPFGAKITMTVHPITMQTVPNRAHLNRNRNAPIGKHAPRDEFGTGIFAPVETLVQEIGSIDDVGDLLL